MITVPFLKRSSLRDDLEEAIQWLTNLGLDYRRTRFEKYQRDVERLESRLFVGGKWREQAYDSALEASDLVFIYKGLRECRDPVLAGKLRQFLEGLVHAGDEKGSGASNLARNTAFELVTTAHFSLAGFSVDLGTLADVRASDGHTIFHIECKRPVQTKKIPRVTKKAYSQLERRYATYVGPLPQRGFLAISFNKLINPENLQVVVDDPSELVRTSVELGSSLLLDHRPLWYKDLDNRTMAVLGFVTLVGAMRGKKGLFVQRAVPGVYVSRIHEVNMEKADPDRLYFHEIIQRLQQSAAQAFRTS